MPLPVPPAPPASLAAFHALVERANGCEALRAYAGVRSEGRIEALAVTMRFDATYAVASSFSKTTVVLPDTIGGTASSGYDGEVWPKDGAATLGSTAINGAPWAYTCGQPGNIGLRYANLRRQTFSGRVYDTVAVTAFNHRQAVLAFDPKSHYLLREYIGRARVDYNDYRVVRGIPFFYKTTIRPIASDMVPFAISIISSTQLEKMLSPDAFARPTPSPAISSPLASPLPAASPLPGVTPLPAPTPLPEVTPASGGSPAPAASPLASP